jgi:hypothetical protein
VPVPAFGRDKLSGRSTIGPRFSTNVDGPAIRHNGPMSEHHHPLTPTQLLSYMRAQPWAIEASVTPQGAPQAAVIGVAVTDRWELLFDTVTPTRQTWPGLVYWRVRPTWIRYSNLNVNPPIIQEWGAAAIAGWLG